MVKEDSKTSMDKVFLKEELEAQVNDLPENYRTARRQLRESYNPQIQKVNQDILELKSKMSDLELNLNYAKQQEKSGNVKSTIATLERLSMLYPKNADIKLYLLSILLKMDSKVKVDLMVSTMLNDPNTSDETRKLIAELLTDEKFEEEEPKKWFAYMDFTYSQTEEDNIAGRTKSGKKLAVDGDDNEKMMDFEKNDGISVMEYDKTYTRGTSLTIGRILNQSSSLYFNLGGNFNTCLLYTSDAADE